ncbi:hypothetical protein HY410_01145 [Candidatus Gottesmanbacteria bacterium]|nr:hypothetical protein [Candidatus Gottesmanbacteria bacterium]
MNFCKENGPIPSVHLWQINGKECVAYKDTKGLPTTYYFPINPADLNVVLGLAIDMYTSRVNQALASDSQGFLEVREQLLELTTSIESPPDY